MITDQALFQGAALLIAVDEAGPLFIREIADLHTSAYELTKGDVAVTVVFKVATARSGRYRWAFTVTPRELAVVRELSLRQASVFFGFVCQRDGVCCVSSEELFGLISQSHTVGQSVGVSRSPNGRYSVTGGRKELDRRVPRSDWPVVLFERRGIE
jgi:hypothetical protein